VKIEFDLAKSARNAKERGLPFERFVDLDLEVGIIEPDTRRDYGEDRYLVSAPLEGRLHVACICIRGDASRIISLRKANDREVRRYERKQEKERAVKTADR
jgi:uncharacterized protein